MGTDSALHINKKTQKGDFFLQQGQISNTLGFIMDIKPEYQTITNLTFTPQVNYYIKKHFNIYVRVGFNLMSEQALTDKHFNEIENTMYKAEKIVPTVGAGICIKVPH